MRALIAMLAVTGASTAWAAPEADDPVVTATTVRVEHIPAEQVPRSARIWRR